MRRVIGWRRLRYLRARRGGAIPGQTPANCIANFAHALHLYSKKSIPFDLVKQKLIYIANLVYRLSRCSRIFTCIPDSVHIY